MMLKSFIGKVGLVPPDLLTDSNTLLWVNLTNPSNMWKARADHTHPSTGDTVGEVINLSVPSTQFYQDTLASRPTLTSEGLLFDGIDDILAATISQSSPTTVYLIVKQNTWVGGEHMIMSFGQYPKEAIIQYGSSPNISWYYNTLNPNLSVGSFGIIKAIWDGSNTSLSVNNTTSAIGTTSFAQSWTRIGLGGYVSTSTLNTNITAKELVVRKGADTTNDQQIIYDYLKLKHNL